MREGRNFFSLPESLKCFLQCLRHCMGPRSITFLARPAEGDGPSTARLNEIPLTSPRKHPKSLAPLRLGTKVRVRGPTKGWGRKCWLPRQRCPGRLVLSARGPGFLPELQESEAIYFHCKTEALERGQGRLQFRTGLGLGGLVPALCGEPGPAVLATPQGAKRPPKAAPAKVTAWQRASTELRPTFLPHDMHSPQPALQRMEPTRHSPSTHARCTPLSLLPEPRWVQLNGESLIL